jgi:hypothetical protein
MNVSMAIGPRHAGAGRDDPAADLWIEIDPGEAVYIGDRHGEIVCWVDQEWEDDLMAVTAMAHAIVQALTEGPGALRESCCAWPDEDMR